LGMVNSPESIPMRLTPEAAILKTTDWKKGTA
jgi:hypothetical protein